MKVVFLQSAEADLKDLRSYIVKNFGKDVWLTSYGKLKEAVAMIGDHPKVGRIPPSWRASTSPSTGKSSQA